MAIIPNAERNKKFAATVARVLSLDVNEIYPHTIRFEWRNPTSGIGLVTHTGKPAHLMHYHDSDGNPRTMELNDKQAKALNEALKQA